MNSLHDIASFATSCNYRHNEYKKTNLVDNLTAVIQYAATLNDLSESDKAVLKVSIDVLRDHAKKKCSGLLARILNRPKKFAGVIQGLDQLSQKLKSVPITGEKAFRIQFLATAPKTLHVKHAPGEDHEQKVINWLSKAVYKSTDGDWNRYQTIMTGAYRGDHLLIEDDATHQKARELAKCGAIVRGSSHYEKGRPIKAWKDGVAIFEPEGRQSFLKAKEKHHGISGKHVRHILFNGVDMCHTKEDKLIPGKTVNQVEHLLEADKPVTDIEGKKVSPAERLKIRHYVALQFESSPDSEGNNILDPKFYTHRIAGFVVYRLRKLCGIEKANIGAYGYGVTDMKPIILKNS